MAGCAKAGRNKNRPSSKRYLAESRCEANKDRHVKKHGQDVSVRQKPIDYGKKPNVLRNTKDKWHNPAELKENSHIDLRKSPHIYYAISKGVVLDAARDKRELAADSTKNADVIHKLQGGLRYVA